MAIGLGFARRLADQIRAGVTRGQVDKVFSYARVRHRLLTPLDQLTVFLT